MDYSPKTIYLFHPSLRFRKESHRCMLYEIDDFFHTADKLSVISPTEVILLMLFDGTRTYATAEKDFRYLYDIRDTCSFSIGRALNNLEHRTRISPLIVPIEQLSQHEIHETVSRYPNPEEFLIKESELKLDYNDLRISGPLSVNYNVMTQCGFSCKYCYHPLILIQELISLERLSDLFVELKNLGCESVLLTGGDPMLRPDIDEIMRMLHISGLFYTLSTKSILEKKRLQWLYDEAGLDRMQLSLDSCDSAVVSRLIGVDHGYLSRFTQMVKDMQEIGMDIRLKAVLTSYNADGIGDFLSYAEGLGIRHVQIVGYGRSGTRHSDSLFPSADQAAKASEIVAKWKLMHPEMGIVGGEYGATYDEPIELDDIPDLDMFAKRTICNAGRFSMTLLPNGEVYICEHLPYDKKFVIGDIRTQSLTDWWNGEQLQQWLSPPVRSFFPEGSPCRHCEEKFYSICHTRYSRCLRFIRELTGRVDGPDIHCPRSLFPRTRST
ncbi:MAG: radical SAM protein [Sphaerochaetaceae bacterium]|nr:radical SAM protein [Sphaerochaetaceae bacterium]